MTGEFLLVWTVRLAVVCYLSRLVVARCKVTASVPSRVEIVIWSVGCVAYVAHVVCAFAFAHDWSHDAAWQHTAIETERLTGVRRGDGLWVNYLFTLLWIADVVRLMIAKRRNCPTRRSIDIAIHAFFAFIVFNATVVFGPMLYRILAVPVAALLFWSWRR